MLYTIVVTLVALILLHGAFRDDRTKREQSKQIEHLKKQNHQAWQTTRLAEQETVQVQSKLTRTIRELQSDADRLRKLIWDHIEKRHNTL